MASRAETAATNRQLRADLLELVAAGRWPSQAYKILGRGRSWYETQRKAEPGWAALVDRARQGEALTEPARMAAAGSFEEFCSEYLGMRLFRHQLLWVDLIEGRPAEALDLHPSMRIEVNDPNHILINVPPDHAKSTTLSVSYVVYRICKDPSVRIVLVSKTMQMAQQFCYAVKQRLTSTRYAKLQAAFGPPGGFRANADSWTAGQIYIGRDSGEKDPTLRCIGFGQQVYGARADLILCDDVVTLSNAHEFEKQAMWLRQEILSRPGDSGKVVMVGTRVAPKDLYEYIRDPEQYPDGKSPWTYLSCPAVLEFAEDPNDWVTLWPRSDEPWPGRDDPPDADGLYVRWDGKALNRRRGLVGARTWAFIYQQQELSDDQVFPAELVRKAVNGMRSPGRMHAGAPGYRAKGMEGLYVVGGVDPAMTGDTAMVVFGLDRFTGIRYLLDARVKTGASPTWMRETIKELTQQLSVNEWRIEKNAFQGFLSQDPELHQHMANLGVVITEHYTGKGKWDHAYGVAAMSLLFHNNLIEFPSTSKSEAVRQYVEQLIVWGPEVDKHTKTDLVMAGWFAEIKCREIMQANSGTGYTNGFVQNRFLNRNSRRRQRTVNFTDLAAYTGVG